MVDKGPSRHPLVVVNGCPRSGTSVLSSLLAKRLNAALMPETHFIPRFVPYLWLWGGLNTVRQRERLIQAIFDFAEIRANRTEGRGQDTDEIRPYSILGAAENASSIARDCHSYATIVEALFDAYRTRHHGTLTVEKTAYYSPPPWRRIAAALPSAKFLHVIRDGRDVALSWRKTWFGPKSIALCAKLWAAHVKEGLEWERACPERCLRVRYEELVQDTDQVLADIAAYAGVPLLEIPVRQSSIEWFELLADHEHMKNLSKPIERTHANRWRKEMDSEEIAVFEALAGDALEAVGYERSLPRDNVPRRALLTATVGAEQLRRLFSTVEWKRYLLGVLPLTLWLSGLIGLSLPPVLRRLRLTG